MKAYTKTDINSIDIDKENILVKIEVYIYIYKGIYKESREILLDP